MVLRKRADPVAPLDAAVVYASLRLGRPSGAAAAAPAAAGVVVTLPASIDAGAGSDNLAALPELSEGALNAVLEARFNRDSIHTYLGDIMVIVNPYRTIPGLYSPRTAAQYARARSHGEAPTAATRTGGKTPPPAPHVFAVADTALKALRATLRPQVCLISGESGAGKTETTKHLIRHVVYLCSQARGSSLVESRLLEINTILEAFGNAQTVMNSNSSRFGKYIELKFDALGNVAGASISYYLLEKSRVTSLQPGERNFHCFDYLFHGLDQHVRNASYLGDHTASRYCSSDPPPNPDQLARQWSNVQTAFGTLGFSPKRVEAIIHLLAAIVHLGAIGFEEYEEQAVFENDPDVSTASFALGVAKQNLSDVLLTRVVCARGEAIIVPLNAQQAADTRDSVAKICYERMFSWLVDQVNVSIAPTTATADHNCIGVLDIFGFEIFRTNSFEQLCVNVANEVLNYHFNKHIFALELAAYEAEGISAAEVSFVDNSDVLGMFFGRPLGILSLLDEECRFPNGSDESFVAKLRDQLAAKTAPGAFTSYADPMSFGIRHYAGEIKYYAEGFLTKNRDSVPVEVTTLLAESSYRFVASLFASDGMDLSDSGAQKTKTPFAERIRRSFASKSLRRLARKGSDSKLKVKAQAASKDAVAKRSVSAQFTRSLMSLVEKLDVCQPHFIRCLKPNPVQAPGSYAQPFVLKQLRYTGLLESTRIRRDGFAIRYTFEDFAKRYSGLVFKYTAAPRPDSSICRAILDQVHATYILEEPGFVGWRLGKTMVFLKYWHGEMLSELVLAQASSAVHIQCVVRQFLARRRLAELKQQRDEAASKARMAAERRRTLKESEDKRRELEDSIAADLTWMSSSSQLPSPVTSTPYSEPHQAGKGKGGKRASKQRRSDRPRGRPRRASSPPHVQTKDDKKQLQRVLKWWTKQEKPRRNHVDQAGRPHPWFHGLIDRDDARARLLKMPEGTYLVRLSQRVNSYVLSITFHGRVRNYQLNVDDTGEYGLATEVFGFPTLQELLEYYMDYALSEAGDVLVAPLSCMHDLNLDAQDKVRRRPRGQRTTVTDQRRWSDSSFLPQLPGGFGGTRMLSMEDIPSFAEDLAGGVVRFVRDIDNKPPWLHPALTREEAEEGLAATKGYDGSFLVRQKVMNSQRAVFVLSVVRKGRCNHHLLTKTLDEPWRVDNTLTSVWGVLEDLIAYLGRNKFPQIRVALALGRSDGGRQAHSLPQSRRYSRAFDQWTELDVVAWLGTLNMDAYAATFLKSHVDGKRLMQLTAQQLRYYVESVPDRQLILDSIEQLASS